MTRCSPSPAIAAPDARPASPGGWFGGASRPRCRRTRQQARRRAVHRRHRRRVRVALQAVDRREGRGLRLTLSLAGAPALLSLPWEFLYRRPRFLASQRHTPLVRHARGRARSWIRRRSSTGRCGSSASSPARIDLARSTSPPSAAASSRRVGADAATVSVAARLARARRPRGAPTGACATATYHVIHYVGHSDFTAATATASIYLEDPDDGSAAEVDDDAAPTCWRPEPAAAGGAQLVRGRAHHAHRPLRRRRHHADPARRAGGGGDAVRDQRRGGASCSPRSCTRTSSGAGTRSTPRSPRRARPSTSRSTRSSGRRPCCSCATRTSSCSASPCLRSTRRRRPRPCSMCWRRSRACPWPPPQPVGATLVAVGSPALSHLDLVTQVLGGFRWWSRRAR